MERGGYRASRRAAPRQAQPPRGGSDPRSGGAWGLPSQPPGRPKAGSAPSGGGSDPRSGGAWGLQLYMASRTKRPLSACVGRAFMGNRWANSLSCSRLTVMGCFITSHNTPSVHGGVVSEPMNW
jgi:hypothetical protein